MRRPAAESHTTTSASLTTTTTPHETPPRRTVTQSQPRPQYDNTPAPPLHQPPSSGFGATRMSSISARSRTRSSPNLKSTLSPAGPASSSSSASSSSTSLPRRATQHSAIHGSRDNMDLQPHQRFAEVSVTESSTTTMPINGLKQRLRTLSGSSSSGPGHEHGRLGVKRPSPPTPGAATASAAWAAGAPHPSSSATRKPSPPARSYPAPPATTSSPTAGTPSTHVTCASALTSGSSSTAPQSGLTFPQRRPSLASPLPPTPIVPSSLPRAALPRSPPAPLNLTAASSSSSPTFLPASSSPSTAAAQLRQQQQYYHSTTGSISSPHSSPQSSPPTHRQKQHSYTPSPSPSHPVHAGGGQNQGWAHAQYVITGASPNGSTSLSRPSTGGASLPDSPSTRAMMKRLLAKPAPVSNFSATSGSESEGLNRASMKRKEPAGVSGASRARRGAALTDGEEPLYRTGRNGSSTMPLGTGIEFDMNLDALDRTIASIGQWASTAERVVLPSGPSEGKEKEKEKEDEREQEKERQEKEKEKEKKPRNVLRRRPSALNTTSNSNTSASTPSSQPKYPPSQPSSPQAALPVLAAFAPLTFSPLVGTAQDRDLPSTPHSTHSPPGRTMHRSFTASAVLPVSPRRAAFVVVGRPAPGGGEGLAPTGAGTPESHLRPPPLPYPKPGSASSSHSNSSTSSPGATTAKASSKSHSQPSSAEAHQASSSAAASTATSSSRPGVTPAASLIEAYKKQEREREERRQAAERERRRHQEERAMVLDARSQSVPSSRRHSIDGVGINEMGVLRERKRDAGNAARPTTATTATQSSSSNHLAVEVEDARRSFVSEHTLSHVNITPSASTDALSAGTGFAAIERMAKTVSANAPATPAPRDVHDRRMKSLPLRPGEEDGEAGATPYYTVFGSSSGHVVAVGGREDSWATYGTQGYWDSGVLGRRTTVSATPSDKEKERAKESLGRSLSRKVSGRWKKQGGAVVGTGSPQRDDAKGPQGRVLGRASMQQDRRMAGGSRSATRRGWGGDEHDEKRAQMRNRRSLRLSIDKFADVLQDGEYDEEIEERKRMPVLRNKASVVAQSAPGSDSDCDTERGAKLTKAKKQETSPSTGGGGKLWKLMKRISLGGLKEKYQEGAPPPVPALPKDYLTLPASRSNDSSLKRKTLQRNTASASPSPTLGGVMNPSSPSSNPPKAPAAASASSPPQHQPRQSTNTRSSSPVSSSDVASSKFFVRPHSPHSSTSSFGEEHPPPLPKPPAGTAMFAQHIIPPGELLDMAQEKEKGDNSPYSPSRPSLSPRRSLGGIGASATAEEWSIVHTPSAELPSLPFPPPRRVPQFSVDTAPPPELVAFAANDTEMDRAESPTIPLFSTTDAVNAFPARRLSASISAKSNKSNKNSPISPHPASPAAMLPAFSLPTSLPPPPRPLRNAQRPAPAAFTTSAFPSFSLPSSSFDSFETSMRIQVQPQPTVNDPAFVPAPTRKSESHLRDTTAQQRHSRRSSDGLSTASTARPRRRSSSFGGGGASLISVSTVSSSRRSVSPPPSTHGNSTSTSASATVAFRELDERSDGGHAVRPLTQQEKAARWDDLLERSARAGGTLHFTGGARVLASDRLRFSRSRG